MTNVNLITLGDKLSSGQVQLFIRALVVGEQGIEVTNLSVNGKTPYTIKGKVINSYSYISPLEFESIKNQVSMLKYEIMELRKELQVLKQGENKASLVDTDEIDFGKIYDTIT